MGRYGDGCDAAAATVRHPDEARCYDLCVSSVSDRDHCANTIISFCKNLS